jgi:hypothetical protein
MHEYIVKNAICVNCARVLKKNYLHTINPSYGILFFSISSLLKLLTVHLVVWAI